jgi:hypothetical protein
MTFEEFYENNADEEEIEYKENNLEGGEDGNYGSYEDIGYQYQDDPIST